MYSIIKEDRSHFPGPEDPRQYAPTCAPFWVIITIFLTLVMRMIEEDGDSGDVHLLGNHYNLPYVGDEDDDDSHSELFLLLNYEHK